MPSKNLLELRRLLSLREKLLKQRTGYKSTNSEIKYFLTKKEHALYFKVHSDMIRLLTKQIKIVENKLLSIIKADEELRKIYELIIGIKSAGTQTALFMITIYQWFYFV